MTGRIPGLPCLVLFDCTYPEAPRVRVDIRHPEGGSTQYELLGPAAEELCVAAADLAGRAGEEVRATAARQAAAVQAQKSQETVPVPAAVSPQTKGRSSG